MAYLAHSLVNLRSELNRRYPHRDKASDGWIGDWRHQRGTSDHNPGPGGIVRALDIDDDGIDPYYVVRQAIKHPATNYVIYNRTIWDSANGFRPQRYHGDSPHTEHIHVSIKHSLAAYNSPRVWLSSTPSPKPTPKPAPKPVPAYPAFPGTLRRGSKGAAVRSLQTRLKARGWRIAVDGDYGPGTESVVRAYQKDKHLVQDGVTGPATWKSVWTSPITK